MNNPNSDSSNKEFICLMAAIMSLAALSIDTMLPALGQMTTDLNILDPNDSQLIISAVFLGMSLGLMLYGPLSDAYGRKKIIYLGISIYLIGTLISIFATDLSFMLIGRVIQGFGVASCRVVSLAMVRDKFHGPEMGKIMSLITVVFIIVPALAPSIGQAILLFAQWRLIFWFIFAYGVASLMWLHYRQGETLAKDKHLTFSLSTISAGIVETLRHTQALGYTVSLGLIFGSFVAYLSTAQQILQDQYMLGDLFSIYFGALALALGFASFANSKLIAIFGMEKLSFYALITITFVSLIFYLYVFSNEGQLSLNLFLLYLTIAFFCLGLLFGNLNALALEPFGHIAGVATSVISSIQTFFAVLVGGIIGQLYDGTVAPLIGGFLVCGVLTLTIFVSVRRPKVQKIN